MRQTRNAFTNIKKISQLFVKHPKHKKRERSWAQTLITIIRSDLSNKCDISKLQKKKKNYLNSSNTSNSREQEHEGDLNICRNRLNIIISASIIVHSDLITRSFG